MVTAPAAAAPGDDSPGAAVTGYVDELAAGAVTQACNYAVPPLQTFCSNAIGALPAGEVPTVQDFALGYVAVDGNEALVGITGTFCDAQSTPACTSNEDPAAIFSTERSFQELWVESAASASPTTTSYALTRCVKVGTGWYLDTVDPGTNA